MYKYLNFVDLSCKYRHVGDKQDPDTVPFCKDFQSDRYLFIPSIYIYIHIYVYVYIFILKWSRKRANPILTVAAITNRTTGEAVRLCTRLVRPLKSTIGQVSEPPHGLDLFSSNTFGASIITSSRDVAKAVCFIF